MRRHSLPCAALLFSGLATALVAAPPLGTTPYVLEISAHLPRPQIPADNPLTHEGVELGRRLFSDPALSKDGKISCASCHKQEQAFSDERRFSLGVGEIKGERHSMPIFNLLWHESFFWDGRAASLREQVVGPIEDDDEMAESLENVVAKLEVEPFYPTAFTRAFGSPGVTSERLALALEQFLFTKISQNAKYDRVLRGEAELTALETRGRELFGTENDPERGLLGAACFHCHGGNLFTNHGFANNGLDALSSAAYRADEGTDWGRFLATRVEADRGKFKVPSLRNVAATAPYMHDGRFATLEEVVAHYDRGVKRSETLDPNLAKHPTRGLQLSPDDKKALVAFLKTLTDDAFLSPAP